MSEQVILEPGTAAPLFSLSDQDGNTRNLADYQGSRVVIFFIPKAMTPGCTLEACDFQESEASLLAAGYQVLCISRDEVATMRKFADRDDLTYPLLSDPDTAVHRAYGVWGEKKNYGRIVEGVIRSTFVIDEAGIIQHALYNVKATGHVGRIRKLLEV